MIENGECQDCKYFMPGADKTLISYCLKAPKHPTNTGAWCNGFEPKTEFISVDISRVSDNERFKATYPAATASDIIVSTSADSTAAVLDVNVLQSYREQMVNEIEKIKKSKVENSLELKGEINLGIIKVQIKKYWKY